MHLVPRGLLGAVFLLSIAAPSVRAATSSGPARWTEWHATADDVAIRVDAAGLARVEHAVRYRVVMGPLRQIDLNGIDKDARLAPEATITGEDGAEIPAHVEAKGDTGARIFVDEPKGLKRGNYTFRMHYDVDLVAAKELVRDGAMWKIVWKSPVASEGYDAAKVTLSVPAAESEPRRVKTGQAATPPEDGATAGDDGGEDGVIATLHRTPDRDELELARPHVARGDSPVWAARVDPKAFPEVRAPEMRPPPPAPPPEPNRLREVASIAGMLAVALAFGLAVRAKMRAFATACARAGARPAPLVPLSPGALGALAGALLGGGIALQALARPTAGAALVGLAMACALSRAPKAKRAPRGPGRWLALRSDEAFGPRARPLSPRGASLPGALAGADDARGDALDALDAGTRAGKLALALAALAAAAAGALLRGAAPEAPYFAAIDALALVPLFFTGRAAQIPPDAARAPVPWLRAAFGALRGDPQLKVAPWARIPLGAEEADELRLLCVPRASLPGLAAIELAVGWARTATGYAPAPEVLVRVHDGSDAAARLAALAPYARPVPGRRPEEKVIALAPRLPGRAASIALVRRLARELVDRRARIAGAAGADLAGPAWNGPERRADRERTDRVPAAA